MLFNVSAGRTACVVGNEGGQAVAAVSGWLGVVGSDVAVSVGVGSAVSSVSAVGVLISVVAAALVAVGATGVSAGVVAVAVAAAAVAVSTGEVAAAAGVVSGVTAEAGAVGVLGCPAVDPPLFESSPDNWFQATAISIADNATNTATSARLAAGLLFSEVSIGFVPAKRYRRHFV